MRKSSRLPISPPFEQSFDFIEVRLQAGDFLGHVDAKWRRPWLPTRRGPVRPRRCSAFGQAHGFLPSFHEALALLLDQQGGTRGPGLLCQGPQLLQVALQHGCQPGAFLLPGVEQGGEGLFGQRGTVLPQSGPRALADAQAQDFSDAQG